METTTTNTAWDVYPWHHQVIGTTADEPIYEVKIKDYVPESPDHDWRKIVFTGMQASVFRDKIINNPPAGLADLQYRYMEVMQRLTMTEQLLMTFTAGLRAVNDLMNEYAEDNNMCGEYERFLDKFNDALGKAGYRGNFEFVGRVEEKMFTVERHRTVVEQMTVTLEVRPGLEDAAEETAVEIAADSCVEDWTVTDEDYSDEFYNVIDISDI